MLRLLRPLRLIRLRWLLRPRWLLRLLQRCHTVDVDAHDRIVAIGPAFFVNQKQHEHLAVVTEEAVDGPFVLQ